MLVVELDRLAVEHDKLAVEEEHLGIEVGIHKELVEEQRKRLGLVADTDPFELGFVLAFLQVTL